MVPQFRADQVGSLIRPQDLVDAFTPAALTLPYNITPETSTAISEAIDSAVQSQLRLSIRPIVTGEYERAVFCDGFFEHLGGMEAYTNLKIATDFRRGMKNMDGLAKMGVETFSGVIATGKIHLLKSPQLAVWETMKKVVPQEQWKDCKLSMMSPTYSHSHLAKGVAFAPAAYSSDKDYFADLTTAYNQNLKILYDAGLRSVQIDDPMLTYFVLDDFREALRREGTDPDELLSMYIDVHNQAIAGLPGDMYTGIHLCRGNMPKNIPGHENFNGTGSYERIAKDLFGKLKHKTLYLEFDDTRSGSFEPLRLVPQGTNVVLGLVSTKSPELEDIQVMKKRVHEAAEAIASGQGRSAADVLMDTLAVSPQCGFATSNTFCGVGSEERMWDKLVLVRDLAREIWSDAA